MKNLTGILLFVLSSLLVSAERPESRSKIALEATYEEGFGILVKKDFILVKINLHPKSKTGGSERVYIIVDNGSSYSLLPVESSEEMRKNLEKEFGENQTLMITGIGYESISVTGSPAVSKSVREEENDDLITAGGTSGWFVEKVFELVSFSLK